MKLFKSIVLAGLMCSAVSFSALAEDIDFAKIKCKDFLEDKANMPMMLMWIDGYMSAQADNTVMSDEWITKLSTHLGTYCAKNPAKSIMKAVEAMPAADDD